MFFSPFSIAITSFGEERANLSAFRTFVRFLLVWICQFPLPLGVWEGLRFVIEALPGLFSYLFLFSTRCRNIKVTSWPDLVWYNQPGDSKNYCLVFGFEFKRVTLIPWYLIVSKTCLMKHWTKLYKIVFKIPEHHRTSPRTIMHRFIFIQRMRSLIWAVALNWLILYSQMILLADSEDPDQTVRMRKLIWAFAVRIYLKTCLPF